MLTGDLVRVRSEGRALVPLFVDPDRPAVRERAEALLEAYREAVDGGWTRGRLGALVDELLGDGRDHKLVRGLAKVLHDRSDFEVDAPVPPVALRAEVFLAARAHGPLALARGPFARPVADDVLAEVARRHGVAPSAIEHGLYADLKEEQRIVTCDVPDARWLVDRYNVALVQALLLKATEVRVRLAAPTVPRTRQLLRYVKFHQLLQRSRRDGDTLELVLDGPGALFRQTTRYGVQLASFFPALLLQDGPWTLDAGILWTRRNVARTLTIGHAAGLRSHLRDDGAYETREQQWFRERFAALGSGWAMRPGGDPIELGGRGVLLPDFTFERDGRVAHLEIVGFWRRDWLRRRLEGLRRHGPGNLVLAVSRKLDVGEDALAAFDGEVVPFSEVVPARRVEEAIERIAR